MKRFHVHVAVANLEDNIRFYSALFQVAPTIVRDDYAKWMLDDPRINFAISSRSLKTGLDHLGIQVESDSELDGIQQGLLTADVAITSQNQAACCYAESNKHWSVDPQGIAWEAFHTLDSIPLFGGDEKPAPQSRASACCPTSSC